MLIGLMADTHDNIHLIDRAVERFNEEGVELVLHAGDYVSPKKVSKPPLKTSEAEAEDLGYRMLNLLFSP